MASVFRMVTINVHLCFIEIVDFTIGAQNFDLFREDIGPRSTHRSYDC